MVTTTTIAPYDHHHVVPIDDKEAWDTDAYWASGMFLYHFFMSSAAHRLGVCLFFSLIVISVFYFVFRLYYNKATTTGRHLHMQVQKYVSFFLSNVINFFFGGVLFYIVL